MSDHQDDPDNPFEALDLDPALDPATLTALLRERAEGLEPAERSHLQGLWQALTIDSRERARHAVLARPRVADAAPVLAALGPARPPAPRPRPSAAELLAAVEPADLVLPPAWATQAVPVSLQHPLADTPLESDPLLAGLSDHQDDASAEWSSAPHQSLRTGK